MSGAGFGTAGPDPGSSAPDTQDLSAEQAGVAEEMFAEEEGVPPIAADLEVGREGEPVSEAAVDEGTLDAVARERDEYRAALQRLQADFENYKKRVAKQQEELRDRAAESLVEKLLPVLDTADLALAHGGGEDVKQMAATMSAALEREGLERIDLVGEPFDPNHHDAVAHEPGDGPVQEVAEVMRAGYRWRGRVIRAAMVRVRG